MQPYRGAVTTVLLAEDDQAIAVPLARALEREGYEVLSVGDGPSALHLATHAQVSMIVLDLGLPTYDGLDVCRRLRAAGKDTPVLMLTARTDEMDIVVGLDAGADDYVGKPFRVAEVLARVRALLRRATPDLLQISNVELDVGARRVFVEATEVVLSFKEFELLRLLMANAGQVVTRERILAEIWPDLEQKNSKTLDMHMSWLRRKLTSPDPTGAAVPAGTGEALIATIRGIGFRFNDG